MKRYLKITGIVAAILFVIVGLWSVDNFYYPFKSVSPNYADVERAFARLQFPADWKEISSSENKGLFGRDCDPMNDAGCFHKSKTFRVPDNTTEADVTQVFISGGCTGAVVRDITLSGDSKPSKSLECGISGGVSFGADLMGPDNEVYISAKTY